MQTKTTAQTIVPRDEWQAARAALLEREKAHTRLGDDLARQRRELPWVRIEKEYTLRTAAGPQTSRAAVRRPLPAPDLPLHVRPELRGRLPGELFDCRRVRQSDPAPEGAGRDLDRRLRGADREATGVSRADGVGLQLGVELRERASMRTSAFRAASSRRERRSSRYSTTCRQSPFAMPARLARTSTVI